MIQYDNIFNQNTLNIFADASITNRKKETIGSAGYVAVIGNDIVNQDVRILRQSTNSESELYAIYMAIQYALMNRHRVQTINLFSDSQFAVYGLREWIFKWVNNIRDDKMYNSSGKEVAHQSIFLNIIYTILYYNLEISIYHNRGHFKLSQLDKFIELFKQHNFLNDYIDKQTATTIIYYNDRIDNLTRDTLYKNINNLPDILSIPEYLANSDLDLNRYKKLLNI